MSEQEGVYENHQEAESRREHWRLLAAALGVVVVLLALITWGVVGCSTYNDPAIACIERGDMWVTNSCVPRPAP
jgi:hypothetical protein